MRALDTNVLVRLLVRDDAKQVAAAEACIRGGAWVSHVVLAEAIWVLTSVYSLSPEQVAAGVEMCLQHRDLAVQDADAVAAALTLYDGQRSVSFADCLILEIARRSGHLPLCTFDRRLSKLDSVLNL